MKHLVLIIALAAFSTSAFAEGSYQNEAELRLVQNVSVQIGDEVRDGCLSNPNALKVEAELILRRSGISITEARDHALLITAIGWERKSTSGQGLGNCGARLDVELLRYLQVPDVPRQRLLDRLS